MSEGEKHYEFDNYNNFYMWLLEQEQEYEHIVEIRNDIFLLIDNTFVKVLLIDEHRDGVTVTELLFMDFKEALKVILKELENYP